MFLILNQFIMKYTVRSPMYLGAPPIVAQDEYVLPRHSVIHYLDTKTDVMFPTRTLQQLTPVPKNKKIPIVTVMDLSTHEGTSNLHNKFLPRDVNKWLRDNQKQFRKVSIEDTSSSDINTATVVNYNGLKDLYNYKQTLLAPWLAHYNLAVTYWNNVSDLASKNNQDVQVVSLDLPDAIPGRLIMDKLADFTEFKRQRVINTKELRWLFDLYLWLSEDYRSKSLIKLSDEASQRVLIEFRYKGKSSFIFLSTLRMLSNSSSLKSTLKMTEDKIRHVFLTFLRRVVGKIENEDIDDIDAEPVQLTEEEQTKQDLADLNDDEDIEGVTDETSPVISGIGKVDEKTVRDFKRTAIKEMKKTDDFKLDVEVGEADFLKMMDDNDSDALVDNFFNENIARVEKNLKVDLPTDETDPETTAESVNPIITYSDEEKVKLLDKKDGRASISAYLDRAMKNKTHTPAEIRSIRKTLEERPNIRNPYDEKVTLDKTIEEKPKDLQLTKENTAIKVKSDYVKPQFKRNLIGKFDKEYIDKFYRKDILDCIAGLEQDDIIIKNYEVEDVVSSVDNYEIHKVTLKPIDGKESTISLRIPKIDSDGNFLVAGNTYKMRKVRTDGRSLFDLTN